MVDGFGFANARCSQYFLTHMHSDHTTGLTRGFDAGTIWASPISTRLLAAEWGLRPPRVRVLQLGQPVVVDGVSVTALDANHCPGAIMLLFEVPLPSGSGSGSGRAQGAGPDDGVRRILHTGDCRWHDGLRSGSSCLAGKRIDVLMLDTTYALPRHTFPPQQEAIAHMAQVRRLCAAALCRAVACVRAHVCGCGCGCGCGCVWGGGRAARTTHAPARPARLHTAAAVTRRR
jgi:DNA cross-link repair 1A protein